MFCTGTFERNLDEKQRLLLPKSVKKSLADSESLFLAPGQDGCLELHRMQSLQIKSEEITQSQSGKLKKPFSRLFFAQAERCQFDSQNRIRIPQRLVDWSGLENTVVVVGVGGYWEIWNEASWQEYCSRHRKEFDRVAEALMSNEMLTETESKEAENRPLNPR